MAPRNAILYSEEIVREICEHLASGKSLRSYCLLPSTPDLRTVRRWLADKADFRLQYALAREEQADVYADEIIEIADTEEDTAKARNRIDARKWIASKLKPKKYGDKLGLSGDGDGSPIPLSVVSFEVVRPKDTDTGSV